MRFFLLSILIAGLALLSAEFNLEELEQVKLKGFQTNGIATTTRAGKPVKLSWRIHGETALVQKPEYTLTGFRMILQEDGASPVNYVIESPRCLYDQNARQVRSDGAVRLTGSDGLVISGIGYDFYWDDAGDGLRMVIRDVVRIEFPLNTLNTWQASNAKD